MILLQTQKAAKIDKYSVTAWAIYKIMKNLSTSCGKHQNCVDIGLYIMYNDRAFKRGKFMLKFATNLKFYRKSISVTQSAFADILNQKLSDMGLDIDYNNKSISMWEKGDRFPDSPLVWIALADIMNVTLDQMMKTDLAGSGEIAKAAAVDLQAELCNSYLKSTCTGDLSSYGSKAVLSSIDEHIGGDLYHGMFYVLSSVKSAGGYCKKYNIASPNATSEYVRGLSKVQFCSERNFVRNIIDNGGRDVVVTSEQISDVWEGFFECLGNVEEYNTMTFYDDDKNHIITIVEYVVNVSKDAFRAAFGASGIELDKAVNNTIIQNKKFHLGVRMAKELIK